MYVRLTTTTTAHAKRKTNASRQRLNNRLTPNDSVLMCIRVMVIPTWLVGVTTRRVYSISNQVEVACAIALKGGARRGRTSGLVFLCRASRRVPVWTWSWAFFYSWSRVYDLHALKGGSRNWRWLSGGSCTTMRREIAQPVCVLHGCLQLNDDKWLCSHCNRAAGWRQLVDLMVMIGDVLRISHNY